MTRARGERAGAPSRPRRRPRAAAHGTPRAASGPGEVRSTEAGRSPGAPAVLVLCLGNPLRRDDAVALRVADALEASPPPGAVVRRSGKSGLYLLDDMEGFERVVVVDAVRTGAHAPGTVHALALEDLRAPAGPSPHAIGLPSALALARRAGAPAPSRVRLVLVEVEVMDEVGEGLTPAVAAAVPRAAEAARAACSLLAG